MDKLLGNFQIETFLASILIWILFLALPVFYGLGKVRKELVFHAFLAFFTAWLFGEMIKDLIPTTRPFLVTGAPPLTLTNPEGTSFPSTHAASVFSLAVTVWLHNRKYGIFYLAGAFGVAAGRVLASVHYPVDVIAGGILGTFVALVLNNLHVRFTAAKITKN
jgi:undecaprenyl-diphosphatase